MDGMGQQRIPEIRRRRKTDHRKIQKSLKSKKGILLNLRTQILFVCFLTSNEHLYQLYHCENKLYPMK